jgi:hypothetical protein
MRQYTGDLHDSNGTTADTAVCCGSRHVKGLNELTDLLSSFKDFDEAQYMTLLLYEYYHVCVQFT